jgi:uncharacterized membrane protein YbhN (UPF0104 family)
MTERPRIAPLLRWAVSLGVLAALAWWLDPASVFARISDVSPAWLGAALAITVVQTLLSAWRWRFTSARLGLRLSWKRAVGDYYVALFVNQVVPGGVAGDALRAHRHARRSAATGPAWRAVLIERASGQVMVVLATLSVVSLVPAWREMVSSVWAPAGDAWLWPALVVLLCLALIVLAMRRWPDHWRLLREELHAALLSSSALPRQLAASSVIVFSYTLVFALVGRGLGIGVDFGLLLAVGLPILLAMLVPLSVAGWGFREAAAASVWLALGLPAEQGVAVAIAYGVVVLVGTLPGGLVLALRPRG